MKRTVIATLALSLAFALPAFAAESSGPPKATVPTFEQKKAQFLKNLDDRSTKLQEERACVQAAKNDNDLKACRNKFGPPFSALGPGGAGGPGGPGGPGGMGRPDTSGGPPPE